MENQNQKIEVGDFCEQIAHGKDDAGRFVIITEDCLGEVKHRHIVSDYTCDFKLPKNEFKLLRKKGDFRVGDRVRLIEDVYKYNVSIKPNSEGTIVADKEGSVTGSMVGVMWDKQIAGSHNCNGRCKGNAYFVFPHHLELVEPVEIQNKTAKEDKKEMYKQEIMIDAKKVLELGACEDGFKWFVERYGKRSVSIKDLMYDIEIHGRESYSNWLKEKLPEAFRKDGEERTYKIGQMFMHNGGQYILAQVKVSEAALIGVTKTVCNGNRFSSPVVVDFVNAITVDEFRQICGGTPEEFQLIEE